jgi:predicted RNA methylase
VSKLSKQQAKQHLAAVELLKKDRLTEDDRWFVLENWQESAAHINSTAGAFFTPVMLARDFAIEVHGTRILDLCAGIGCLSFMAFNKSGWGRQPIELTCVELNPDYAAVGQKVLPEARWIIGDIFSLPSNLGRFDCVISNPPFGSTKRNGDAPRYHGRAFEYHVIDIASDFAECGAFIIPQNSAPFRYSGQRHFETTSNEEYERFHADTGIRLEMNCGIDTECHRGDWRGVAPAVEIVCAEFSELQASRVPAQQDLFEAAE